MNDFDPSHYGEAFASVLRDAPSMPLDAGRPDRSASETLAALPNEVAAELKVVDPASLACCQAAVKLLYGFLDEAHALVQDVPTASGSYWHGIMHRREADYGNAGYWFRQAGDHPSGALIASAAAEHPETVEASLGGRWDPHRFNDLVRQAVQQGGPLADACRAVQQAEWQALFDFCWRRAIRPQSGA